MASTYPSTLDSFATDITDATDQDNPDPAYDHASVHNNLGSAVVAIETELGTNPSGAASTVASRLSTLDTTVAAKALATDLTAKADLSGGKVPQTQIPTNRLVVNRQSGSTYSARTTASVPELHVGALTPVGTSGFVEVTGDIWIPA